MLESEWDADYGQAKDQAERQMHGSQFYASEDQPDYVHDNCQTCIVALAGSHFVAERTECQ